MTTNEALEEFKHLGEPEWAFISGRLIDVDPEKGRATLSIFGLYKDRRIPLRFDDALKEDAIKLNQKSVEITGQGWINDDDTEWVAIIVEEVAPPPRPRTLDEFRNDPNPKIFDPDKVIRASEPFDVDEFIRVIYEGRGRTWNG